MNQYISQCCNAKAKKPALVKPKKGENQTVGLGKWRCTQCGNKTKVNRRKSGD